jgi:hypothetical protein
MADPISIIAIAGLAYIGKKLSDPKPEKYQVVSENVKNPGLIQEEVPNLAFPRPVGIDNLPASKIESNNFADIVPQTRSSGGEVLEMRDRMFDGGRMNNLSPIEKQLVGPGIAIGPEVPAAGGFQQIVRVNPENVGAHRLTTLPGRSGPAHDVFGGRRGQMGDIANNRPEKTAFLPERRPVAGGRAQGFDGHVVRSEHVNGKRLTNRSQTGSRNDGLEFPGGKRIISGMQMVQDPTRNKKDGNIEQYGFNNQVQPGVSTFAHGYLSSPSVQIGEARTYGTAHTTEELSKYGFRPDDRRGKANRVGNAGRMNVRAGPLNQGGMPTVMRADTTRVDGRTGPVSGGWTQQYKNDMYYKFNAYKGNTNPYATAESLGVAKQQLQNNPITQQMM